MKDKKIEMILDLLKMNSGIGIVVFRVGSEDKIIEWEATYNDSTDDYFVIMRFISIKTMKAIKNETSSSLYSEKELIGLFGQVEL